LNVFNCAGLSIGGDLNAFKRLVATGRVASIT